MLPANLLYHGRIPLATESATQSRNSSGFCTESFQRYASSKPTLKRPTTGLLPIVARNSLPDLPLAHGGMRPWRACRSATSVGASSPIRFMSSVLVAPPVLGITHESGLIFRTSESQRRQSSNKRSWRQTT